MSESHARYHSIALESDYQPGTYKLKFSTMPGMSTSVGDLQMGDLTRLANVLAGQKLLPDGMALVAFDPSDAISVIQALRDVVGPDVLRIVANAELVR